MKRLIPALFLGTLLLFACENNSKPKTQKQTNQPPVRRDTGLIKLAKDSALTRKMDAAHSILQTALVTPGYEKIKGEVYNLISLTYALEKKYPQAASYIDSAIIAAPDSGKHYYHRYLLNQKDSALTGNDCDDLKKAKSLGIKDQDLENSLSELGC